VDLLILRPTYTWSRLGLVLLSVLVHFLWTRAGKQQDPT
jgi:hypothetical protein